MHVVQFESMQIEIVLARLLMKLEFYCKAVLDLWLVGGVWVKVSAMSCGRRRVCPSLSSASLTTLG